MAKSTLEVTRLGFAVVFLCIALLYRHAFRRRLDLELTETEEWEALLYFRHYLIFALVGLLSALLAWQGAGVRFGLPGWIYGLLGPLCYAHGVWSEKRRRPAGAVTSGSAAR